MESTSYVALSRQTGLRRQLNIVANNLANMSTSGFKGEKMMFVEHLTKSKGGHQVISEKVAYVRDIATLRDFSEGPLESTGNPFDLAISGEGYFTVQTDQGNKYTRNGRFQIDQGGQLVNQQGYPVLADGGQPIFFAPGDTNISISKDGTVATDTGDIGKLSLVKFENPQDLRPGAGGMFSTEANPIAVENPAIQQGMLEGSNVLPIIEMTRMIDVHRTYDSVKNLIEREDDRQRNMIRELAKVG
jgi:flagellar basal-body rod protein FlgF